MDTEVPTEQLVARAQTGDRSAFEKLVQRFRERLEVQVRSRMGRKLRLRLEVEDVLQETFAVALESIAKLQWQGEESFYRWLGSIAEHLLWNSSQKKAWDQIQLRHDVPGEVASPSKNLRRNERFDRLERALLDLSGDYRKVLKLARIDGLTVKEIAQTMSRSPDAVKKILARAMLRLRKTFGDTESLHLPDRSMKPEESNHDE